jgi:hypothetical protein
MAIFDFGPPASLGEALRAGFLIFDSEKSFGAKKGGSRAPSRDV